MIQQPNESATVATGLFYPLSYSGVAAFHDLAGSTSTISTPSGSPASVPQKRARTKRVTFKPTGTVRPIMPIDEEYKSEVYYSREELSDFRREVKDLCRNKRRARSSKQACQCAVHANPRDYSRCASVDPFLRGLEQYLCYLRARNKVIARKGVLKCQRKLEACLVGTDVARAGSLAICASELNSWACQVALETGRLDSLAACSSDYLIPVLRPMEVRQECLLPYKKQTMTESRRVTVEEDEEPELVVPARKRRRF